MKTKLPLFIFAIILTSCGQTQQEFTHTYKSPGGISGAQLIYAPNGTNLDDRSIDGLISIPLREGKNVIPRVNDVQYSMIIKDDTGVTTFEEIPSKYVNMDVTVEISRNVFQPYFPEEWAAMKGAEYTTVYIQKVDDSALFYLKTVYTGTNKEIGKHSEDY